MKQENWYDVDSLRNKDFAMSTAFPALMRKVFVWMTLALAITGLTAYGVATSPTILSLIFSSKVTFFGLIIAEFALVFAISGAINRLSLSTATMLFILYSVINGATLSSIFFAFSVATIGKVFFITAGTFGAMALVGYTTKTDLTSMGKLLFMALLGIIIASVVNMFVASSSLDLILSYVGVLVFVGLTAYDTQKIKQMCQAAPDAGESAQKLALIGALSLYLDFINLFLYLLRIFGNNRD
ncbi:Bax inhibitor-1/YccA family protein [Leyella stercorea]|uniref:Bax inhibitor-1/YccA family protein n=1 Tax=Leyella stercorea TaxID=363265 RepID=UPI001F465880|nr:Bax inhibitor-1/YccA family protein [Leyella stercorea]MCF2580097.1 Bax inhibitor-1/YccA family protein [Leyella stercorea]